MDLRLDDPNLGLDPGGDPWPDAREYSWLRVGPLDACRKKQFRRHDCPMLCMDDRMKRGPAISGIDQKKRGR
jgi:hypothetical protein